jgi:hypothetical protein
MAQTFGFLSGMTGNTMVGTIVIYADAPLLSNVRHAHGARPFASVDPVAERLHSAINAAN